MASLYRVASRPKTARLAVLPTAGAVMNRPNTLPLVSGSVYPDEMAFLAGETS